MQYFLKESESSKSGAPDDYCTFTVSQTGDRELDGAPIQTYTIISNGSQIVSITWKICFGYCSFGEFE